MPNLKITLMGHLLLTVKRVAQQAGLNNGYRVVINLGPDGGQTSHLHLHILGGADDIAPG